MDTSVRPKVKVSEDSKVKLKALGFPMDGSVMVCFLCGRVNSHYARECNTYEGEICSSNVSVDFTTITRYAKPHHLPVHGRL